ncbi:NAD(P)H-dependent glycerol-3-phosphate dehydrogenase [Alkalicoccobacillus plakortidis]|uniref:Glycerol-3-phosphate dehydrogenase [NAD(P)+] n=1 Tax=Alkalicoccobacillus plakortidis TaxID=444060 RepID=A0ABT0XEU6_9BACI|nr:NAD(P)H-dependent glycerol-3-phosphate dehydrogenase [Alkalicoccobacillus plakortidis]MCM2674325.1 NAD(P)H-dependent glycerol-3-phosphate dehydrogenase [Alkalicoccobacillus plakortidis]
MTTIAVLGSGSWGTALGMVLADNGHDVRMWARRSDQIEEINTKKTNARYLPDVILPENMVGFTSLQEAVHPVDVVVLAVPVKAIREETKKLLEVAVHPLTIIHVSKGIEPGTQKRVSEMIEEEAAGHSLLKAVVALSGPSHAEEVSRRQPTTVTVSSLQTDASQQAQDLFMNQNFRVYTHTDLVGVELGGALKNIIALVCGVTNGLGYGDNTKAAIMTRGLAEITRMGVKLGADPLTFSGLSGLGDLIVTCTSVHSRNFRAGKMIGQGLSLDEVLDQMGMAVEGVRTTQAAFEMAKRFEVEMPITNAIYNVLFNDVLPHDAAGELMGRVKKHEEEQLGK